MINVSVIMPAYNAERTIKISIESVLNQTFTDLELIIVDDCSSDDTEKIIREYTRRDRRVKYYRNSVNLGVSNTRNKAIELASGRFIAFLDSDDSWLDTKLDKQLIAMADTGLSASHTNYFRVDTAGNILSEVKAPVLVEQKTLYKGNCIGNLTGIYDRSVVGKVFQKNIGHEDFEMWLNILSFTNSIGINEPLANYMVQDASISSNKLKAIQWHYNILKGRKELSKIKRYYCFFTYIFKAIFKRF